MGRPDIRFEYFEEQMGVENVHLASRSLVVKTGEQQGSSWREDVSYGEGEREDRHS